MPKEKKKYIYFNNQREADQISIVIESRGYNVVLCSKTNC